MKPRIPSTTGLSFPLATALAALISAQSVQAVDYFWDPAFTTTTTGTGASGGTWNTTNTNWVVTAGSNVAFASANRAVFGGAAGGVVTVGSSLGPAGMLFNTNGYTLSAASAQTITSTGNVSLASSSVTATIGSNVTVARASNDIITTATGTGGVLNIGGTDQLSTGARYINTQSGSTGARTLSITNGTVVNVNSGGYFGQSPETVYVTATNPNGASIIIGSATGGSLVVKTGGTVTNGNNQAFILGGASASGTLTIDGGQVNAGTVTVGTSGNLPAASAYAGLRFGAGTLNASGTRIANLNGGVLTVGQIYTGTSAVSPTFTNTFNFNGGTLQASIANTTFMTGLTTANVQVGGAKIDTNNFDITIGQALVHDATLGATLDGGLTKSSAGRLTLTNTNTYTGGTAIKNGSLALDGATRILATSSVVLGDTGTTGKLVLGGSAVGTQTLVGLATSGLGGSVVGGNASATTLTLGIPMTVNNSFSGIIGGSGTNEDNLIITKSDVGTLTLSGNNRYTGATNVNAGTLNIQHANALGTSAGATSVVNNATLQLQSASSMAVAAETLNLLSNSANFVVFQNVSGNNEWTGTIASISASTANAINISSDSGLLTLSGGMSSSGAPYTLRGNGNITITGKITGATGLTSSSSGSGTRTLSNVNNDYTGATIVGGGRLSISSTGTINSTSGVSIGAGEFNYNNSTTALTQAINFTGTGGTLSGTGTITPAVTITNGNRQTAGTSVTAVNSTATLGKETFGTGITYDSGSIFEWNLTGDTETAIGTRGTDYDAVNTASLGGTGGAIFRVILNGSQNFSESFWDVDRTWAGIFQNVAETSAYDLSTVFDGGFQYRNSAGVVSGVTTVQGAFSFINGGTDLKWTAVPEPTSALAGLLIGAGLLRRRRA